MGKMYVLNHSGDTMTAWRPEVKDEVEQAEQEFKTLKSSGHALFEVEGGQGASLISTFKPDAEEIVAVRQIAGG